MASPFEQVRKATETVAYEDATTAFSRATNKTDEVTPSGSETSEQREQRSQGKTREIIAVWLLGLLCAVVGLAFAAYFLQSDGVEPKERFTQLKTLLDVLVGPIITLLSSAVGFYFGSRTAQASAAAAVSARSGPGGSDRPGTAKTGS